MELHIREEGAYYIAKNKAARRYAELGGLNAVMIHSEDNTVELGHGMLHRSDESGKCWSYLALRKGSQEGPMVARLADVLACTKEWVADEARGVLFATLYDGSTVKMTIKGSECHVEAAEPISTYPWLYSKIKVRHGLGSMTEAALEWYSFAGWGIVTDSERDILKGLEPKSSVDVIARMNKDVAARAEELKSEGVLIPTNDSYSKYTDVSFEGLTANKRLDDHLADTMTMPVEFVESDNITFDVTSVDVVYGMPSVEEALRGKIGRAHV